MSQLRQRLKQSIAVLHQQLEDLSIMQIYSGGNASLEQYLGVTRNLLLFWGNYQPDTRKLPPEYQSFYESYIAALQVDVGESPAALVKTPINEIAFYYVLLGSGLGGQVILERSRFTGFPQRNLEHLAENSGYLWRHFITEPLVTADHREHETIANEALILFDALFSQFVHK